MFARINSYRSILTNSLEYSLSNLSLTNTNVCSKKASLSSDSSGGRAVFPSRATVHPYPDYAENNELGFQSNSSWLLHLPLWLKALAIGSILLLTFSIIFVSVAAVLTANLEVPRINVDAIVGRTPDPVPLESQPPSGISPSDAPTLFHTPAPTNKYSVNSTDAPTLIPTLSPTTTHSIKPFISFIPTVSHKPSQSAIPSKKSPLTTKPSLSSSTHPKTTPSMPPSNIPTLFDLNPPWVQEKLILAPGRRLYQGQIISNANGRCKLVLLDDGNLIIKKYGKITWSSGSFNVPPFNTHDSNGPFFLKLQKGGAMVIRNGNGDAVYSTRTRNMILDDNLGGLFFNQDCSITIKANNEHGDIWTNVRTTFYGGNRLDRGEMIKYPPYDPQYILILQNDGNLILFEGEDKSDFNGQANIIWSAGVTSSTNRFFLKFTCDGRLVLKEVHNSTSVPYWSMNIPSENKSVVMQGYSLVLKNDSSTPFGYDPIDAVCQTESYTQERFVRPPS